MMKATVVDLRYRMNDVLKALERKERVTITHRGKAKGIIEPLQSKTRIRIEDHPFFGMTADDSRSVESRMEDLRGPRRHAV
jgi:antitoxin (DNA-binding transcriptional repressor) of toxin-antitoxin stability system